MIALVTESTYYLSDSLSRLPVLMLLPTLSLLSCPCTSLSLREDRDRSMGAS